jgi:hypothetical protein
MAGFEAVIAVSVMNVFGFITTFNAVEVHSFLLVSCVAYLGL